MPFDHRIERVLPLWIFIICLIIIAGSFFATKPNNHSELEGKKINNFDLVSIIDNNKVELTQPVILHLFATWCITCKIDHRVLVRLKKEHNIKTIGIIFDDATENVLSWFRTNKGVYDDIAMVGDEQVFVDLAIKNIPDTFLIAKDTTILYSHAGELKEENFHAILTKYTENR